MADEYAPSSEDNERVARLMSYVTPLGYSQALYLLAEETRLIEARIRLAALMEELGGE